MSNYLFNVICVTIVGGLITTKCYNQEPVIQWQNAIGGNSLDKMGTVNPTSDGGYIVGGYSFSDISSDKSENHIGGYDYWVIKLTHDGLIEWENTIGGAADDILRTVVQTVDGGYIVGGYSKSGISGDKTEGVIGGVVTTNDYWIVKLDSLGNIEWQNTIGGFGDDYLVGIAQTSDFGFLVGGYSNSSISGDKSESAIGVSGSNDYWIVKINSVGVIEWQNTIGGSNADYLTCLINTPDDEFLLGGYSFSENSGDKTEANLGGSDYWVVKIDSNGNIIWQNTIGGTANDELKAIDNTNDGGYIVGGTSSSNLIYYDKSELSNGGNDYWILKLDEGGNIVWQNTIGGSLNDNLTTIRQTSDGEYIVAGDSYSTISGDKTEINLGVTLYNDYWILKLDSLGNILWQNTLGGSLWEYLTSINETSDGGYFVGGYSHSTANGDRTEVSIGSSDIWLIKLGPDTSVEISFYYDIDKDGFGSTVIGGYANEAPAGFQFNSTDCNDFLNYINPIAIEICDGFDNDCDGSIDEMLLECNAGPSIEWQNTIGGNLDDLIYDAEQTDDGGYILVGLTSSPISGDKTEANVGDDDFWVMKIDGIGNVVWQNTIGGSGREGEHCNIVQMSDGGYIIGGSSESPISGDKSEDAIGVDDNWDYWVIKLNELGEIIWENTIGGTGNDELQSIFQTTDNGFILGGYTNSPISGDLTESSFVVNLNDYWVVKLDSLGNIVWQNTIGGTNSDFLKVAKQTADGGFILAGYSNSPISGDKSEPTIDVTSPYSYDYWILKLDPFGNIEWQNTIGGDRDDYLNDIVQMPDGGYVLAGYSYSKITGDKTDDLVGSIAYADIWVVKINAFGLIEWQNNIGGTGNDYQPIISLDGSNKIILGCYSYSGNNFDKIEPNIGNSDIWVMQLDSIGNIVWQNSIGSEQIDLIYSIEKTYDGGYFLAGASAGGISGDKDEINIGPPTYDFWILKLIGDCIPTAELCNALDDNCNGLIDDAITETISITAGGPISFCQGSSVLLTAIYSGTSVQWKKNGADIIGATSATYNVTTKGNYSCVTMSACGTTESTPIYVNVIKNPNASISAAGATTFCAGGSVTLTETPSGGCTYQWYKGATPIAGATSTTYVATTTGNYKCRVTKTATGCYKNSNAIAVSVPCRVGELLDADNVQINVYPNPAQSLITIQPSIEIPSTIQIRDMVGQLIIPEMTLQGQMELDVTAWPAGIYFLQYATENKIVISQFVKQ